MKTQTINVTSNKTLDRQTVFAKRIDDIDMTKWGGYALQGRFMKIRVDTYDSTQGSFIVPPNTENGAPIIVSVKLFDTKTKKGTPKEVVVFVAEYIRDIRARRTYQHDGYEIQVTGPFANVKMRSMSEVKKVEQTDKVYTNALPHIPYNVKEQGSFQTVYFSASNRVNPLYWASAYLMTNKAARDHFKHVQQNPILSADLTVSKLNQDKAYNREQNRRVDEAVERDVTAPKAKMYAKRSIRVDGKVIEMPPGYVFLNNVSGVWLIGVEENGKGEIAFLDALADSDGDLDEEMVGLINEQADRLAGLSESFRLIALAKSSEGSHD